MIGLLHLIRTSPTLRSALVALLLGCLSIGVLGDWLVFRIIRADIRQSVEEKLEWMLPEEELTVIAVARTAPPEDFYFTEKGREFRYQGKMYDIVRQEVKGDTIYYTCLYDLRESQLYTTFEQQLKEEFSTNPQHQTKHTELIKKIPKVYLAYTNSIFWVFTCYTQQPDETHPDWLDAPLTIDAPPPELG